MLDENNRPTEQRVLESEYNTVPSMNFTCEWERVTTSIDLLLNNNSITAFFLRGLILEPCEGRMSSVEWKVALFLQQLLDSMKRFLNQSGDHVQDRIVF